MGHGIESIPIVWLEPSPDRALAAAAIAENRRTAKKCWMAAPRWAREAPALSALRPATSPITRLFQEFSIQFSVLLASRSIGQAGDNRRCWRNLRDSFHFDPDCYSLVAARPKCPVCNRLRLATSLPPCDLWCSAARNVAQRSKKFARRFIDMNYSNGGFDVPIVLWKRCFVFVLKHSKNRCRWHGFCTFP